MEYLREKIPQNEPVISGGELFEVPQAFGTIIERRDCGHDGIGKCPLRGGVLPICHHQVTDDHVNKPSNAFPGAYEITVLTPGSLIFCGKESLKPKPRLWERIRKHLG